MIKFIKFVVKMPRWFALYKNYNCDPEHFSELMYKYLKLIQYATCYMVNDIDRSTNELRYYIDECDKSGCSRREVYTNIVIEHK